MLSKDKFLRLKTPFFLSLKIQGVLLLALVFLGVSTYLFDLSFVTHDDRYGVHYACEHIGFLQIIVAYAYTNRLGFINQLRTLFYI